MELGKLSVALKSYIKTHTKFCKVHKMYYNNDFIVCPKCFPNEKDIEKIPSSVKENLTIITAEEVGEVLNNAIVGDEANEN